MFRHFAEYLLQFASTAWGPAVLVVHAYLEAFLIPVAHEFFLIPVCLATPKLSFLFALMSTVASTLGIMTGYTIGRWGGRPVLEWFFKSKYIKAAEEQIHCHDVWAIAIAIFTPFPDKVFAILAGSINLNVRKMIVVSFLARGTRFFITSLLIFIYGERAREWILNNLVWILAAVILVSVLFVISWYHATRFYHGKSPEPKETAHEA